jgi:hypothetical protein
VWKIGGKTRYQFVHLSNKHEEKKTCIRSPWNKSFTKKLSTILICKWTLRIVCCYFFKYLQCKLVCEINFDVWLEKQKYLFITRERIQTKNQKNQKHHFKMCLGFRVMMKSFKKQTSKHESNVNEKRFWMENKVCVCKALVQPKRWGSWCLLFQWAQKAVGFRKEIICTYIRFTIIHAQNLFEQVWFFQLARKCCLCSQIEFTASTASWQTKDWICINCVNFFQHLYGIQTVTVQ